MWNQTVLTIVNCSIVLVVMGIAHFVLKRLERVYRLHKEISQLQARAKWYEHNIKKLYDRTGEGRWIAEQSAHIVDMALQLMDFVEDRVNRQITGELSDLDLQHVKRLRETNNTDVGRLKKTFDETVRPHLVKTPWKPGDGVTDDFSEMP